MGLRDYQHQAVQSIFDYFQQHQGNPVVVMPTGTGKSHVIGGFIQTALQSWPQTRVMVLTHVKELVQQNAAKLRDAWPAAPMGIYSAGLGRRDTRDAIIIGGVASVVNRIAEFGRRDLLIIDECHLLSPNAEGRYAKVIEGLRESSPSLRVIGLSATPYRLGQGHLCDGGMFTHVCAHQADVRWFSYFISAGYLAPVIGRKPGVQADLSGVRQSRGDYQLNQLQDAMDREELTRQAVANMVQQGRDRKRWLVFAAGVEHAQHVSAEIERHGIKSRPVYGALPKHKRDECIDWYREPTDEIRVLVNNNVLTTGFDHPPVDLIGMLRPTTSPSLWVQMVGRGMRPAPGKENCLVLDFAGNTERLGPVNDPVLPRKRGSSEGGAPPIKICPECDCYNHTTVRTCYWCGYEFPIQPKITPWAAGLDLLANDDSAVEEVKVDFVSYHEHYKPGKPTSLKVTYHSGLRQFNEWVCFEHPGHARTVAEKWWARRTDWPCPETVEEAIIDINAGAMPEPKKLRIWHGDKYPKILHHFFA